jgi:hypothetical protein
MYLREKPERRDLLTAAATSAVCVLALMGVALALAGAAFAQADRPFAVPRRSAILSAVHELVPAYFGPEGSPDPWQTMCDDMNAGSTAILNPDNGPVKREAKSYLEV